jgi:hypothetical protein
MVQDLFEQFDTTYKQTYILYSATPGQYADARSWARYFVR